MEGIAGDQATLDAAIARWTKDEIAKAEAEMRKPSFRRAQLGHNNNVKYKGLEYHIQTEDSGLDKPHVITHLFADGGRVIKSHKRSYAEHVARDDVAPFVRQLMKGQQMEMAIMLREGRFDAIIAGKAVGGMETLDGEPQAQVQRLATKREEKVEVAPSVVRAAAQAQPQPPPSRPEAVVRFRLHVVRSLSGGPARRARCRSPASASAIRAKPRSRGATAVCGSKTTRRATASFSA
jgi:hypothetical protein